MEISHLHLFPNSPYQFLKFIHNPYINKLRSLINWTNTDKGVVSYYSRYNGFSLQQGNL